IRRIENGTGGTEWVMTRQTYNVLGNPLMSVDERGRRIRHTYLSNNQDISAIQYDSPESGNWINIRTFTYPTPNNHLPVSITEGSGVKTTFTRKAEEQVTMMQLTKGSGN